MADDLNEDWLHEEPEVEKPTKKRKNKEDDTNKETPKKDKENSNDSSVVLPKKKRKTTQKKKQVAKEVIDSSTLWNFFTNTTKGKLSKMEIDELEPENKDASFLNDTLEAHTSLDQLSPFLIRVIPRWPKAMQSVKENCKGSPVLLIICGSARRAVDVSRAIQSFKTPSCKTAKLFAKHFKLEEQQQFLSKSMIHVGIGTPNRIFKLASEGFLKLGKLKYIIFDWNHKDPKERRMVDIPEIKKDIIGLLQEQIFQLLKTGNVKFGLF